MSFVFPALLTGLLLAGIPVLLHLIMKQKPKRLPFPAFRFLLQRHRTNQRKLRLRHLLLLALRMLLLAAICLALARPKIFSERINLGGERPVAAVMVFDTSYSMGYLSGGKSRLDEAKKRAQELLNELPDGSKVAILDTAEPGGEWQPTLSLARERLGELHLRPANGPVTSRLSEAYRLLADLDQDADTAEEPLPRFLYVFSDRTQESWDQSRLRDLQGVRDRINATVHCVYLDVGVDNAVDLALTAVDLPRQIVPTNSSVIIRATVRATGAACDTEVACYIDGETPDKKPVKLDAGQSQVIQFERSGLKPGTHQAEIKLATTDSLAFNNALFATFEVRGARQVLVLRDTKDDEKVLAFAFESFKAFDCKVLQTSDLRTLGKEDLARYQVICLLNVANPDKELWDKLMDYVAKGGGLAIMPGEANPKAYNTPEARRMMPGELKALVHASPVEMETKGGVLWKEVNFKHPIMARFREHEMAPDTDFRLFPARVVRYWAVERQPGDESHVVVPYDDEKSRPALLERNFDHKTVRGRVLLFTTALDWHHLNRDTAKPPWNNYPTNSFYLVLVNETISYLAGDAEEGSFNYLSGQTVTVALPATQRNLTYTLSGPGVSASDAAVTRSEGQPELTLTKPVMPGNYTLFGAEDQAIARFSLNVAPDESQLARVPPEQIGELLGTKSILTVGQGSSLRDALQGHWNQPVELFPWLMMLILLLLAVENLLANKFYRRENAENTGEQGGVAPSV